MEWVNSSITALCVCYMRRGKNNEIHILHCFFISQTYIHINVGSRISYHNSYHRKSKGIPPYHFSSMFLNFLLNALQNASYCLFYPLLCSNPFSIPLFPHRCFDHVNIFAILLPDLQASELTTTTLLNSSCPVALHVCPLSSHLAHICDCEIIRSISQH